MKIGNLLLVICLFISCQPRKTNVLSNQKLEKTSVQSRSSDLKEKIEAFNLHYTILEKNIYDSVAKYKTDNIDFSSLTNGLEKKYSSCTDDTEKTLLGFKLAANYLIHYDSSKKVEFKEKAEPLFVMFLNYNNGNLASQYMKLDLKRVLYIQKEWKNFTDKDRETLLFYGLLRGFNNGVPEFLKDIN